MNFKTGSIITISCLLVLLTSGGSSQIKQGGCSIEGTVTEASSGAPLQSVNVFLRGTTKGTTSLGDGTFTIANIPEGEFDLVFSLVGYERAIRHVSLKDSVVVRLVVPLTVREIKLAQVEVTGSADEWNDLLPVFTRVFLGETKNAQDCRLLNPEVLNLSVGSGGDSLRAYSDSTLVIENNVLGYRLYVQIDSFLYVSQQEKFAMKWYPHYEEMQSASEKQVNEWKESRAECYKYSFTHFLKSIIYGRAQHEDFRVAGGDLYDLIRAKGDELKEKQIAVEPVRGSRYFRVDFGGRQIRVDRLDEFGSWRASMEKTISFVTLDKPVVPNPQKIGLTGGFRGSKNTVPATAQGRVETAPPPDKTEDRYSSIVRMRERPLLVDRYGNLLKSFSVVFFGFWETRRLADTLPFDYEPGG